MRAPGYQCFSLEEYRQRLDALRGRMEQRSVDALLVTGPENLCYLTGYQTPRLLLVPDVNSSHGSGASVCHEKDRGVQYRALLLDRGQPPLRGPRELDRAHPPTCWWTSALPIDVWDSPLTPSFSRFATSASSSPRCHQRPWWTARGWWRRVESSSPPRRSSTSGKRPGRPRPASRLASMPAQRGSRRTRSQRRSIEVRSSPAASTPGCRSSSGLGRATINAMRLGTVTCSRRGTA